mgnify:CR=1 FL=1
MISWTNNLDKGHYQFNKLMELTKHHVGQWEFLGITTYTLKPCLWQPHKPNTKEIITDNLVNWSEPNLAKNVKHKKRHTNKLECRNIRIQNFKYERQHIGYCTALWQQCMHSFEVYHKSTIGKLNASLLYFKQVLSKYIFLL